MVTAHKTDFSITSFPARWRENLARCLRCGLCREVCPAFRALGQERFSPRGRLALLELAAAGDDVGAPFPASVDYCLACRACAERCPSGVAGDILVLLARAVGYCRGGFPFFASRFYVRALGSPCALAAITFVLWAAQKVRLLPGALRVLALPPRLALPTLPPRPFAVGGASFRATGERRGKVIYFVGCGVNYFSPRTARAVVALLTGAGYDVVVPRRRRCCGLPALAAGDVARARRWAVVNVAALAGDAVVAVDCGSCGEMLASYYSDILEVPGAASLKSRVRDFTQLLAPEDVPVGDGGRVAYHDSCHLGRGMGVRNEPRALLGRRGEVAEIETSGAVVCCGGAGVYGLTHADVYNNIGRERAAAITATGAGVVAAGCPACVFYLNESLRRLGAAVQARHTADILAEGVKKG